MESQHFRLKIPALGEKFRSFRRVWCMCFLYLPLTRNPVLKMTWVLITNDSNITTNDLLLYNEGSFVCLSSYHVGTKISREKCRQFPPKLEF